MNPAQTIREAKAKAEEAILNILNELEEIAGPRIVSGITLEFYDKDFRDKEGKIVRCDIRLTIN